MFSSDAHLLEEHLPESVPLQKHPFKFATHDKIEAVKRSLRSRLRMWTDGKRVRLYTGSGEHMEDGKRLKDYRTVLNDKSKVYVVAWCNLSLPICNSSLFVFCFSSRTAGHIPHSRTCTGSLDERNRHFFKPGRTFRINRWRKLDLKISKCSENCRYHTSNAFQFPKGCSTVSLGVPRAA